MLTNEILHNKASKDTELNLGNLGITELPIEIFDCVWLEELKLTNLKSSNKLFKEVSNADTSNKISTIPLNIIKLENLKIFHASNISLQYWEFTDDNTNNFLSQRGFHTIALCN